MKSVHRERDVAVLARTLPDGRIAFVWLCGDPTLQSQMRASLRATLPLRSDLTYDALMREWVCPASAEDRLRAWADRWATRQEWEEPRHTGHHDRATGPLDAAMRDAYARLHLLPSAPPELVTAAYRTLAQLHHPDRSGNTSAMIAINQAVATLRTRRTA